MRVINSFWSNRWSQAVCDEGQSLRRNDMFFCSASDFKM